MARLVSTLETEFRGDVLSSEVSRKKYSRDESIFSISPEVIVCPRDDQDLITVLQIAKKFNVGITARGGGTSIAGQAIGEGIVIDFTKYMNQILDVSQDRAIVQPGVILDTLNQTLLPQKRMFAPDPSSHAICTIGGMVGNNAAGPRTFKYDSTRDHVRNLRCILADAQIIYSKNDFQKFRTLVGEVSEQKDLILSKQPKTRKNSSGYYLPALLETDPDLTKLMVGSEGTLALMSEIELETVPLPTKRITTVMGFETMEEALAPLEELRRLQPASIELVDHFILNLLGEIPGPKNQKAALWIEWEDRVPPGVDCIILDAQEQSQLWNLRSIASQELQKQAGDRRPLRCIEDGVVPPTVLVQYVQELREILRRHDCDGPMFGHAGDAHIHVNPNVDVAKPHLRDRVEKLMEDAYGLILKFKGSISGEHGDGLLRTSYSQEQWKPLWPIFEKVKETFDPDGLLNPGKKISKLVRRLPPLVCFDRS